MSGHLFHAATAEEFVDTYLALMAEAGTGDFHDWDRMRDRLVKTTTPAGLAALLVGALAYAYECEQKLHRIEGDCP
jgi:hypothetical protein